MKATVTYVLRGLLLLAMVIIAVQVLDATPTRVKSIWATHRNRILIGWNTDLAHGIGANGADLVLAEFTDYQCAWCSAAQPIIDSILALYKDRVRLVVYPVFAPSHEFGRSAAIAAECAADQSKFLPYQRALYRHQGEFGSIAWDTIAREIGGIDLARFQKCLSDSTLSKRVETNVALAKRMGVVKVPTLFLNGMLYRKGTSLQELDSAVRAELNIPKSISANR